MYTKSIKHSFSYLCQNSLSDNLAATVTQQILKMMEGYLFIKFILNVLYSHLKPSLSSTPGGQSKHYLFWLGRCVHFKYSSSSPDYDQKGKQNIPLRHVTYSTLSENAVFLITKHNHTMTLFSQLSVSATLDLHDSTTFKDLPLPFFPLRLE